MIQSGLAATTNGVLNRFNPSIITLFWAIRQTSSNLLILY